MSSRVPGLHQSRSADPIRIDSRVRPRVQGKFLYTGSEKLFVRGLTYGPFRANAAGEPFPSPDRVERDFRQLAAVGANAVRTYDVPPAWLLDTAAAHGLRVLAGLPWEQHVAFLDESGIADRVCDGIGRAVAATAGHAAILAYAVGNEIPAQIVRWSGQRRIERHLERLYETAKAADPTALVTYVNYPSTEYLRLDFLDFVCFNVYLESVDRLAAYIKRLQNVAGERPLLMGEIGLDSATHGPEGQANGLEAQLATAFGGGCAGVFVFSWTDEWHTGGHDVDGWEFGVTTREREPKPALFSIDRAFAAAPFGELSDLPRISVVVCAHNAQSTLHDCLRGATRLDYPDYEVIVIDDGSTDRTAAIAGRFEGVRLIRTANQGLSKARNTGIEAATGEIVAFTDADARPDPHWLTYLAGTLADGRYAGVGGPNLAPPGDGPVADCVATAPGGPVHVLLSDDEAEHIPGCNMAFRRTALEEIDGFDPRFRVAGDDVDLCWRIQERGWKLGYSPAAVVWHHARDSVRAYWRQQSGYGRAEALLEEKWPEKYNSAGHITWGGRVYGGPGHAWLMGRSRVYHGVWGAAPFQPAHPRPPGLLGALVSTPEWYLVIAALAAASLLGLAWAPLLFAIPGLIVAVGAVVMQAVGGAMSARFPTPGRTVRERLGLRALTAWLHLIQPAARLRGRLRYGLTPWRLRAERRFVLPQPHTTYLWSDSWRDPADRLRQIERRLLDMRAVVLSGGAFDRWDLLVRGGASGRVRVRSCTEEHGEGRQFVRVRVTPVLSQVGAVALGLLTVLTVWALVDGALTIGLLFGAGLVSVCMRAILECGAASAAAVEAVESVHAEESGGAGGVAADVPGVVALDGVRRNGRRMTRPRGSRLEAGIPVRHPHRANGSRAPSAPAVSPAEADATISLPRRAAGEAGR